MCEVSEEIFKEGVEEGREKGILATIEAYREMGLPSVETQKRIIKKFSLTEQEARKYMAVEERAN